MKIWAHRGCSQMYPENTLLAFEKAAAVQGLTGILYPEKPTGTRLDFAPLEAQGIMDIILNELERYLQ